MRNSELGRPSAARPLWQEADNLRERVAEAAALYGFFSFDAALAQRASHGHLRTSPAARAALIRLCAAPNTRAAVLSARPVGLLEKRLRLHRLAYVGVHGADVKGVGLRLVTEPDREQAEKSVQRLRRACQRTPALQGEGIALEDRVWGLVVHLRHAAAPERMAASSAFGELAQGEGLVVRHGHDTLEAIPPGTGAWRAALGLLVGHPGALAVYAGAGEADEEAFTVLNRRGAITVHVGEPPRTGTAARFQVANAAEVIRLIHWLADARRRAL